jgi:uncharacterized protein (TIGR02996 family)
VDSEEAALLAAIIANPECDTARLVYADWLQEHGQEDRAEFIRVQVELESHQCNELSPYQQHAPSPANGPCFGCERVRSLRRRDRNGVVAMCDIWRAELPIPFIGNNRSHEVDWAVCVSRHWNEFVHDGFILGASRGMIDRACCPASVWLSHGDAIRAKHPVTKVRLTTVPDWFSHFSQRASTGGQYGLIVAGVDLSIAIPDGYDCAMAFLSARWPGVTFELPEHQ